MTSFLNQPLSQPRYVPQTAWMRHGPFAMWLVKKARPRRIVELGTHYGYSYFAFCQAVQEGGITADCFAVDTWTGDEHSSFYGEDVYETVERENRKYHAFSTLLRKTFAQALDDIEDGSVDLLHVDGRHYYDDVKTDFETWKPKLSKRAVVLFHDTMVRERGFGVHKYWAEISKHHPSLNFLHEHGLGVLFWGENCTDTLSDILALISTQTGADAFCTIFETSGDLMASLHNLATSPDQDNTEHKNIIRMAQQAERQNTTTQHKLEQLQKKLIIARNKPLRMLKHKILYRILKTLSKYDKIFGTKAVDRFKKSAEKRNPHRREMDSVDINSISLAYSDVISAWQNERSLNKSIISKVKSILSDGPLISVVVPVYNPEIPHLIEMIESVRAQSYENWELCIADDCSNDLVKNTLLDYCKNDVRIKVLFRDTNGHISNATNSAISLCKGEYISFLDHDDILDIDALLETAVIILRNPEIKFIYTDEDKISDSGDRIDPHFKPDWNLDLLYSHNYIKHFCTFNADLIKRLGGLSVGKEGAQDYDLILRASEIISSKDIHHIPKVLYHWRASKNSTANNSEAKPYAKRAGQDALKEHLSRLYKREIHVEQAAAAFTYKVLWPIDTCPLVSIIIPTRDNLSLTRLAVESLLDITSYENYEVIIIDNGSIEPETLKWFDEIQAKYKNIYIKRDDRSFNYSALNNAAVNQTSGEYVLLLNNDIEIIAPDWLSEMVSLAVRPGNGCVGAKLYYPDGQIQHAGVVVGIGGVAGHVHCHFDGRHPGYFGRLTMRQNFTAVTAACLLVKRSIYDQVGGLNEADLAVAFNDIDFCLKVHEAGYKNVWTPFAEMIHHESASRGYDDTPEKRARFAGEVAYMKDRWNTARYFDPAYNPNLTRDHGNFSFSEPRWAVPILE